MYSLVLLLLSLALIATEANAIDSNFKCLELIHEYQNKQQQPLLYFRSSSIPRV